MNTIEKKVEAAMHASQFYYTWYLKYLNEIKRSNNDTDKRWAIRCRTLAVVNHDRVLNGR